VVGLQAYLRPSGAARWSKCAGYAALCAALGTEYVEETDNEVREDGTACHWLADQVWNGSRPSVGSLSPNGREITEEMYAAVEEYHGQIRSWGADDTAVAIEQPIPVSQFFPGVADGTPDAWSCDGDDLFVIDLKYGFRPVDVWRNAQLIVYAWTLVCMLAAKGIHVQRVHLYIVQPRAPHRDGTTRGWVTDINELASLAEELAAAAQACYAPNPPCTPGPYCGDCPGAYACRSLQAAAGRGMEVAYDATPFVLNEAQLGYELHKLMQAQAHIENRINGLSTQAESLVRKGTVVPGFGLSRRATRWRWRADAIPYVQRLGELLGVEVMDEPKLKTVPKLRDAFPIDVQALYAEKPEGELKLRPIDPNEAIKAFMQRK
jgi:hypothetical protein